jgi:hypothetical protein
MAGESRPVLELVGVEHGLIIAGKFQGIAVFFLGRFRLRFGANYPFQGIIAMTAARRRNLS